jgi:phosphoribosylanthranilate isomerase
VTWVKVCGVTDRKIAEVAADAGADAIGLVLAVSPRMVTVDLARQIGRGIPVVKVLVTVDMPPDELIVAVEQTASDGVQPHGRHAADSAGAAQRAGLLVLRPVSVNGVVDLGFVPAGQLPLLDAAVDGSHGGSGRAFDWNLVGDQQRDFVLAGGLDPENVANAVARVRPFGVDASSGLESAPGVKDAVLVRRFVERAKAARS